MNIYSRRVPINRSHDMRARIRVNGHSIEWTVIWICFCVCECEARSSDHFSYYEHAYILAQQIEMARYIHRGTYLSRLVHVWYFRTKKFLWLFERIEIRVFSNYLNGLFREKVPHTDEPLHFQHQSNSLSILTLKPHHIQKPMFVQHYKNVIHKDG